MPAIYILDTDICSYAIRENPQSIRDNFWKHRKDDICISAVTHAELIFGGIHKGSVKLQNQIKTFVSRLRIIDFNTAAAEEYAQIRQFLETHGIVIGNMDMLIAASAKSCGAVLVSNNQKHFSRIPNLKIENWR
ncbi:MAG: type II toxin-antitoxin system VapC family toxin [Treponema sp.]|jgi:tRNA(fMet)-specific endonuclease VapC|nr:type II toxin-antitoxin system VapC family toxin [Treponema sp.]